jgi:hypothetical protein
MTINEHPNKKKQKESASKYPTITQKFYKSYSLKFLCGWSDFENGGDFDGETSINC